MPYTDVIDRTGAAALIPEEVSAEIIQDVPKESAVLRLGTQLPNMTRAQTRMPVLSSLPTAYFVAGDTGLKQTTEVAWANKYINAEEIACIVPIPDAVLDDAGYDVWAQIKPLIGQAIGKVIDAAVLIGTNAPVDWPDDLLTQIAAASQSVDLSNVEATGDLYDALLGVDGVIAKVEEDGFMVNGHAATMSMRAKLRGLRDGVSQPIFMRSLNNGQNMQNSARYELDGAPIFFLENGAVSPSTALLFAGDWNQLVYSIRQDITYTLSKTAVIQDVSGNIVYNAFQQDMTMLRVVLRLGWQVPNPLKALNETEATRFPFAALVP